MVVMMAVAVLFVIMVLVIMVMMLMMLVMIVVLFIILDGLDPAGGHGDFFVVEPVGVEDFVHRYIAVFAADDLRSGLQGTEDRFDLLEFCLGDEVALVQHDGVAELDLLDEQGREVLFVFRDFPKDFTAAELVLQTGGIDDGNDVVDVDDLRHALTLGGLTHHGDGLGDGHRLTDAGRLDDDVVILVGAGQVGQLLGKVLGEGAADAAVGQGDEVPVLHGDAAAALFDETGVDVDLADVIDDDGDAVSVRLSQDFIEKCGLAGAEVTLDEADFTRGVFCAHWEILPFFDFTSGYYNALCTIKPPLFCTNIRKNRDGFPSLSVFVIGPSPVDFFDLRFHVRHLLMRVVAALSGRMDGTGICAGAAVAGGDPLFAVCHHFADDEPDENDQDDRDQDGPGIGGEPGHGEHLLSVLSITDLLRFGKFHLFGQGRCFFIRPEELEAHET